MQFEQIREALEGLRYGQVTIVIHDGAVVQIDRTEKRRFRNSSNASTS
ncbi:MAG: YezD family protein [Pirellula sp.]